MSGITGSDPTRRHSNKQSRLGCKSATAVCLALLATLGACSESRYTVNKQPDLAKLENELTVGKSTEQDVVAALGQPSGKGGMFVPIAPEPRNMFSYYFENGKVRLYYVEGGKVREAKPVTAQVERTRLYVWFDHGIYEGYMWMTSSMDGVGF